MIRLGFKQVIAIGVMLMSIGAAAQTTPVGIWHSIDDETGKPSAEIQLSLKGEELVGIIVRGLLPPKEGDEPNCTQCTDDRKDKPKRGLEIIRGLKQTAGTERWEGGTIIDPNKGKVYKLRMVLQEGGTKLQVRGYVGPFYRTQTWTRVSP